MGYWLERLADDYPELFEAVNRADWERLMSDLYETQDRLYDRWARQQKALYPKKTHEFTGE